jgi:D-sedoheptulose 7-phosphate isomerase
MKINSKDDKMTNKAILDELTGRYPRLADRRDQIEKAADCIITSYREGKKVLICGNGGSSSDSDHIAGELLKGFENKRMLDNLLKDRLFSVSQERGSYLAEKLQAGLPAISLSAHSGLMTAVANDTDASLIYAQQVMGFGVAGDVLIGLTTSGNARNVIDAAITARAKGMTVIGMTGETGGKLRDYADILINVPEKRTAWVQELHLPVYHTICLMVENYFFGDKA